jgi:hypothetical protein
MRLNLTGRGLSSLSVGRPGSTLSFGRNGLRGTVGIPGSGLSYSSRLSSGSGTLPALIVAIFAGIFCFAARGNRFAQAALVAIVVGGALLLITRESSTPDAPISISGINTEKEKIEENQGSMPSQPVGPALENSASRLQPSKTNTADGVRLEPSEGPTASSELKAPKDAQTAIVERVPPGSVVPGLPADGTSNGLRSPEGMLNLSNTADALRAQLRLKSLGYRVGKPDGVWGMQSQFALNDFRRAHKLRTIAQWDEETQAALFSEANKESGSDLEAGQREMPAKVPSVPAQNSMGQ